MVTAIRLDPALWERCKRAVNKDGKPWNARKAQQAVKLYKDRGGKYSQRVKQGDTNLAKWTREDWGYVSEGSKRYLPKPVRDTLSPAEKAAATRTKQRLGERDKYPPSILKKMRELKI